ncbi:MAG TPA: response regulator transcription factor [Labilithrix sp.]|nr:response regulator transcription factor [Labilithrix sp.]
MKILVVEDDRKLTRVLTKALSEEGYAVDLCKGGREALALIARNTYALLVLDWMLPELDGIGVCREVRRLGGTVPIVMVSARLDVVERVTALDAGADDYLTKPFHLDELLARVRAAIRRGRTEERILRVGGLSVDVVDRIVQVNGRIIDVTPREYSLLVLLARHAGQLVARAEILAHVWRLTRDPGSNLLDVNIRNLREKLGADAPVIETVRGAGYRLAAGKREP